MDLKEKTLSWIVNNQDKEIEFEYIEISQKLEYCLAVTLYSAAKSVDLLDYFEQRLVKIFLSSSHDVQCNSHYIACKCTIF